MREIHLDTNFLIGVAKHSLPEDTRLRRWLRDRIAIRTSTVAWAEFLCGPLLPEAASSVRAMVGEPIPLTEEDASRAAKLFNATGRRRGSLNDCMIAAIAMRSAAGLATNDSAHFTRYVSLGLAIAG